MEFEREGESVAVVRSTPRGAVYADLAPGDYRVTLVKEGFGSKNVTMTVRSEAAPHQFRLLSDGLLGYVWPKWVRSGERSEFRVHSVEPYRLSLWRYGLRKEFVRLLGWFDEHGPRAVDADHARRRLHPDRRRVEQGRLRQPAPHAVRRRRRSARASTTSTRRRESGAFFSFPWVVAPADARRADRRARLDQHLERLQQLRRAQQLHQRRPAAADARSSTPGWT